MSLLPGKNFLNIYGTLHFLFEKTVNPNNWGLSDFILLCFFLFLLEKRGCTYKERELTLVDFGESRLIQVSNYYYYYYRYYYYYYCYYCYYYYYIIIIKGPMLTNFACIALRRWPGNIMKKNAKDLS